MLQLPLPLLPHKRMVKSAKNAKNVLQDGIF
jgi:hypothetical protein